VNAETLLEACFLGVVASDDSHEGDAEPGTAPSRRQVAWDEANLAVNDAERGVEYGTMKIDQSDTPFLYYQGTESRDESANPPMAIHSKYLPPEAAAEQGGPGPRQMEYQELQRLLGLVATNEQDEAILEKPKYVAVSNADFERERQAHYEGEAQVAAASVGLPEGWAARLSTSEPREIFYVHIASNATQWERPGP